MPETETWRCCSPVSVDGAVAPAAHQQRRIDVTHPVADALFCPGSFARLSCDAQLVPLAIVQCMMRRYSPGNSSLRNWGSPCPLPIQAACASALAGAIVAPGRSACPPRRNNSTISGTLNTTIGQSNIGVFAVRDDTFVRRRPQPGVIGGITGIDLFGDLQVRYRLGVGASRPGRPGRFFLRCRPRCHARFLCFPARRQPGRRRPTGSSSAVKRRPLSIWSPWRWCPEPENLAPCCCRAWA